MKLRFCLALIAVSLAPFHAEAAPKNAAVKTVRRSVLDYFRLLPDEQWFNLDREKLLDKSKKPIIDLGRDYLSTSGYDGQPGYQIAVFRFRGRDLIAVSSTYADEYDFDLLRYEKGKWKSVKQILPPVEGDDLHFVLPRYGTTIRIFASDGTLSQRLFWRDGRFETEISRPKR